MSKEKLFSFNTPEFSDYNLEVVSFKGSQEIGELYSYEIDLVSKKDDIDFDKMLRTEVSLQLHNKDADDIYIHGVLAQFEAHQKIDEHIYYKAYLVPKLWRLSMALHQQIFLDKKVPDILEGILKDSKFTSDDYELRLQGSYDKREYVCQYKESRYDFLRRWMEREGIYFYFEQDENGCKVIITDAKDKHKKLSKMDKLLYRPSSGLQNFKQQAVSSIVYRSNSTIKSVRMKNYNYEKPSLEINSVTQSSTDDYTQTYLFGNNLSSQDEAKKLSDINTQKYLCLAKEMSGESNIVSLTPGCIYTLSDYFKDDLNDDYLMLRVESEGSQRGFLSAGFTNNGDESSYYQNTFMMIPSQTQFRMQTTTLWPHIGGMISATIDGQGSGDTAEVDKDGRYKVIMPFDVSGRKDAKASAYMRMAQPSAGEKQGIHFPLHKGTEVLIAFKGGDPDQPIITGAVPNINSPSPVNDKNVTKSVIQTHGGNIIHMEDTPGKAHIKMAVHDDLSSIVIHNHDDEADAHWGIALKTVNGCQFLSADFENTIGGNKEEFVLGFKEDITVGAVLDVKLIDSTGFTGGLKQEITAALIFEYKLAGGWDIAVGPVKVISPEHTEFKALERKVVSNRRAILISSELIADNTTSIEENTTLVATEKQSLIDNELKVVDDKVTAIETDIVTATDKTILAAALNIEAAEFEIAAGNTMIDVANMNIDAAAMEIEALEISIVSEAIEIEATMLSVSTPFFILS